MGMVQEMLDVLNGTNIAERQERQWQTANQCLVDAAAAISDEDSQAAIASALFGLLSLQLSRT